MPIFMDFHDLPDGVSAKHVAEMHQADLDIEHKYNCRGLTYWCDEKRQTAFCLIDAPNKQAVLDLHQHSHGAVPQRIIEVNDAIVESFLGRIEDPEKSKKTTLNIINDPAFRTLIVVKIKHKNLRVNEIETLKATIKGYTSSIKTLTPEYNGRLVRQEAYSFLMSFASVTDAIHCGLKIKDIHNCVITPNLDLKIGISAGIPVSEKEGIFEDTIKMAERLCEYVNSPVSIASEVKDLYESEHLNVPINSSIVQALSTTDEKFLNHIMDHTEQVWDQTTLNVGGFCNRLGYSKSQLYRKMMFVLGKSPNTFIKDYRLEQALLLLQKQTYNISEIAFKTGFNSPAYFSKCFRGKYEILPSKYI
ncbi:nickel-binding protein [Aequorivita sp. CIP111184]|uniref:nickel-binding protein n=1 Tax=Aequorivita sp. CIP111184 TaxID=2211356 RepID=UPI000DBC0E3B|nr:nickel-binding protein [Aequorivita sp. CIP111184]SRX55873.1 HTH-type transcriptional regulator AppY [Aequorivita sp. CIP111184]